jgi:hypothetical protein
VDRPFDDEGGHVAALTKLEAKLGECLGLAMATRAATTIVIELTRDLDEALADRLETMQENSAETEERCSELAGTFDGKEPAILALAQAVKGTSTQMLLAYLDADSDASDGFEFLTIAVASEVAHWSALAQYNVRLDDEDLTELIAWAVPVQQRHLQTVLEGVRELAAEEDPESAV